MAHIGEYSIATRFRPDSSCVSPASSCCRPAYTILLAGQCIEVVAFDGVHETARLTGGRDQVVPPPRRHVRAAGQPGQPRGDRVGPVKVVEQPSVQAGFAQSILDCGHIERHNVILCPGFGIRDPGSGPEVRCVVLSTPLLLRKPFVSVRLSVDVRVPNPESRIPIPVPDPG